MFSHMVIRVYLHKKSTVLIVNTNVKDIQRDNKKNNYATFK